MRYFIVRLSWALILLTLFQGQSFAQSVQVGSTGVALASLNTVTGATVSSEWNALASNSKTQKLLQWVGPELGCSSVKPDPAKGFTDKEMLRYTQTGSTVSADDEVRLTFIPLNCTSPKRYPKATATLLLTRSPKVPTLAYPRLLVRYGNNGWMVEEFSYRKDGKVTKMTCKFGDCVFRTGLHILEQRNGLAFKSLMAVLNPSAQEPVFSTLQRVYDMRKPPVGQADLALYSGILVAGNYEEEFSEGYVSGTLTEAFKPIRGESWLQQQAKKVLQSALNEVLKKIGSAFLSWLGGLFGF